MGTVPRLRRDLQADCEAVIRRLETTILLLKSIGVQDSLSHSSAEWLRNYCDHAAYQGLVLQVPLEGIFTLLEELKNEEIERADCEQTGLAAELMARMRQQGIPDDENVEL